MAFTASLVRADEEVLENRDAAQRVRGAIGSAGSCDEPHRCRRRRSDRGRRGRDARRVGAPRGWRSLSGPGSFLVAADEDGEGEQGGAAAARHRYCVLQRKGEGPGRDPAAPDKVGGGEASPVASLMRGNKGAGAAYH